MAYTLEPPDRLNIYDLLRCCAENFILIVVRNTRDHRSLVFVWEIIFDALGGSAQLQFYVVVKHPSCQLLVAVEYQSCRM